jgi:Fic family protein
LLGSGQPSLLSSARISLGRALSFLYLSDYGLPVAKGRERLRRGGGNRKEEFEEELMCNEATRNIIFFIVVYLPQLMYDLF